MRSLQMSLIVSALSSSPVVAQPMFLQQVSPVGNPIGEPTGVGDLNGDGVPDMVLAGSGCVFIALGDSAGGFAYDYTNYWCTSPSYSIYEIIVVDLDNDSDLDLVVVGRTISGDESDLYALMNDGSGALTSGPAVTFPSSGHAAIAIGDFNDDGFVDVATSDFGSDGGSSFFLGQVLLNDQTGAFPMSLAIGSSIPGGRIAVGDLNGDSLDDVVIGEIPTGGGRVAAQLGNGDGTFGASMVFQTLESSVRGLGLADLDLDSDLDVIVTLTRSEPDPGENNSVINVLHNDGTGVLDIPPSGLVYPTGQSVGALAIADVNNDGLADVLLGNDAEVDAGRDFSISLGTGLGTLGPIEHYELGSSQITDLNVADLNGDGHLDVVLSSRNATIPVLNQGDGTFPEAEFGQPGGVDELVDINGDGRDDVIAHGSGDVTVGVSIGQDVEFRDHVSVATYNFTGCPLEDFDGDGDRDIILEGSTLAASIFFCSNDGTGLFSPLFSSTFSNGSISIGTTCDIDGDGDMDIIGAGHDINDDESLMAFLNDGTAHFTDQILLTDPTPQQNFSPHAAADLNNDGRADLLVHFGSDFQTHVLMNLGGLTFQDVMSLDGRVTSIGDVDGDGVSDLAMTPNATVPPASQIHLGAGDGTFSRLMFEPPGYLLPENGQLIDIDGDGDLDLAGDLPDPYDTQLVIIFFNQGDGTFLLPDSTPDQVIIGTGPFGDPVFGDIDGDGDADIAYPGSSDTVLLFNQTITAPCPGDATGDGSVDFDDLNLVLANWNLAVAPGSSGDVTGDGQVDFDDLNVVLGLWGAACP